MPLLAFQLFGPAHLAALGLIVLVPLGLAFLARRSSGPAVPQAIGYALASVLVASKLAVPALMHARGTLDLQNALPMHLCDWASVAAVFAFIGRWRLACEMTYFWGLAGTSQAVLTPDIDGDFSDIGVVLFFIAHGGVISSVVYLTLGLQMRPQPGSVIRIFVWTNVYAVAACTVNALVDANYGYLRSKPEQTSLIDYLGLGVLLTGRWPLYILSLEVLAFAFFLALYAPFFIADKLKARP